ncbi:MAG: hypothetical protein V1758_08205, partial [Pseudomonadota bacterium]
MWLSFNTFSASSRRKGSSEPGRIIGHAAETIQQRRDQINHRLIHRFEQMKKIIPLYMSVALLF